MASITQTKFFENDLSSTVDAFFHAFKLGSLLKMVGAYKSRGIPVLRVSIITMLS
jgi:hypothetical protein